MTNFCAVLLTGGHEYMVRGTAQELADSISGQREGTVQLKLQNNRSVWVFVNHIVAIHELADS